MSLLNRKNMLWEGSRMFLPEHREQLQALREKQNKKNAPRLANDQIEELNWTLQEALHHESPVILEYVEGEQLQSFCGFIEKVNPYERSLFIVNGTEKRSIATDQIYRITIL